MPTVSQLVEDVAVVTGESFGTVRSYAHALIDGGILPSGDRRAVERVEPEHIMALMLAVALKPETHEVAEVVSRYMDARLTNMLDGEFLGDLGNSAREFLTALAHDVFMDPGDDQEAKALRRICLSAEITIVRNWPEIEVAITFGDQVRQFRFEATDAQSRNRSDVIKRTAVLDCRALIALESVHGRNYIGTWSPASGIG